MDIAVIIDSLPLYFQGIMLTIELLVIAVFWGLLLAVPVGVFASSKLAWLNFLPKSYIYFFRGTPLLVQMLLIYNGFAQFELIRNSFLWAFFREAYWCALLAFVLNTAAYTAEIIRGSIQQTPYSEIEAARAFGMSHFKRYSRIILPSALRRALPAYGNELIFTLHGTALAGAITLVDLFGAARIVNSRYFVPFEAFITAGLFYLCLTFLIVYLFRRVERKMCKHLQPMHNGG